jgi:osmotically-inducible protein OsmY
MKKARPEKEGPRSKETILKKIQAQFESERRINLHRHPIRVGFSGDDLVLEGQAENIAAKKLALEIAGSVRGAGRIVDRLRVAPAEPMGDAEIRDRVCKLLIQETAFDTCTIRASVGNELRTIRESDIEPAGEIAIEVRDGVVMLNGPVPSLCHKRLAGVLAWWVPGSRDVVNGLEEVPTEADSDDEITDAVRLVLEKDPFVNSDRIRATTRRSIVTLEGAVPSKESRELAEFDAWYVFGVDGVVNNVHVGR